jgi:signal transduction histidine kinase
MAPSHPVIGGSLSFGEDAMLVATVGHELRTPMNGVVGFADLLTKTNLSDEQSHYVSMIQESANSLLCIIEDLLDYAKLDAVAARPLNSRLVIRDVVDDVINLIEVTPDAREIEICSWIDPGLPAIVQTNPAHVRQVLLNFVANAAAFTAEGRIDVIVKSGARAGRIRFEVADTGIGIAAGHLPMLFRPFSQISLARRRVGGTGLGLAICKRLVEEMPNGIIGVSSTLGVGSIFWFEADLIDIGPQDPLRGGANGRSHLTLPGAAPANHNDESKGGEDAR